MSSRTTFDDAITHSRTSNATMVDSDGLVKWAPHNLLLRSEEFDSAAWTKVGVTATASSLVEDTSTGNHRILPLVGITVSAVSHTVAIDVKPAGRTRVRLTNNNLIGTTYDLIGSGSVVSGSGSITSLSDGWYRISTSGTSPTTERLVLYMDNGTGLSYTGDGVSGIEIRYAHLYRSDLGGMVDNPDRGDSYVPTTSSARYLARRGHHVYNGSAWVNKGMMHESEARTNLVTYSEDFTDASWNKINILSANVDATGPDGLTSATSLVETTANASHYTYSLTGALAANWTATVYIKQKSPNRYLQLRPYGVGSGIAYATFDPADGSLYDSGGSGLVTTTSSPVGNGWYRVSMTCSSALPAADDGITITLTDGTLGEVPSYTGDGTSGVYIYGAQVEAASTPSSYIPTSGATATRAADTLTVPSANLPWPTPTVIGDELVTNGGFDTDLTGWTFQGTATDTSTAGFLSGTTGPTTNLLAHQVITTVIGKTYRLDITTGPASTAVYVSPTTAGGLTIGSTGFATSGNKTLIFVAKATTTYLSVMSVGINSNASIDNISVKEINPLALSIQMQGEMTYADTGVSGEVTFSRWLADADNLIDLKVDTTTALTGRYTIVQRQGAVSDFATSSDTYYSPGVNVPFNIASRHGSTFVNGAVDGTALTEDTTPTALPDLSATDLQLGFDYMGTIKLLRIWSADLGDAGIAEAST